MSVTINLIVGDQDMSAAIETLKREIAELRSVRDSVVSLLKQLSQRVAEAALDRLEVERLAGELDAEATALADAVVANTDVAPDVPPAPVDPSPVA